MLFNTLINIIKITMCIIKTKVYITAQQHLQDKFVQSLLKNQFSPGTRVSRRFHHGSASTDRRQS
jgi:hypothetical protein